MMHLRPRLRPLALASLVGLALASCSHKAAFESSDERASAVAHRDQPAEVAAAGASKPADKQRPALGASEAGHKVIRIGHVELVIARFDDARGKLDALVRDAGGYIDSTRVVRGQGEASSATIIVRVPTANFGTFVPKLAELGEVRSESTSAQDITDEYVDVAARLASAQKLEARLLELATARTGTIDQVLAVERELARVRSEIEGYQGHLRVWDDRIAISTLTIELTTKRPELVAAAPASLGERTRDTFDRSVGSLRELGEWLVVNGLAALPWLVWMVPGFVFVRRRVRRGRLPVAIARSAPDSATVTATPATPDA